MAPSARLPVDTIKGPAFPSASVSLTGKLSRFLPIKGVTSRGSSFLSKKRLENAPKLWPQHHPAPRPVPSPARAAGPWPAVAGRPGQAWALAQEGSGRQKGSRHSGLLEPCPPYSHKRSSPLTEGSQLSSSPRGSARHQLHVHSHTCSEPPEYCPQGPGSAPFALAGQKGVPTQGLTAGTTPAHAPSTCPHPEPSSEASLVLREYHFEGHFKIVYLDVYCRKSRKYRNV